MWLYITIHRQSTLFTTIRQLEFAILQPTQQFDELTIAVQHVMSGKEALCLINHTTLHGILKIISLHLPENCDLIIGIKLENIELYYDTIKTALFKIPII